MNNSKETVAANRRAQRVVSLPCGHQVYVGLDASLIAVSGPVLDHQATCRGPSASTFVAWFVPGPFPKNATVDLSDRHLGARETIAPIPAP